MCQVNPEYVHKVNLFCTLIDDSCKVCKVATFEVPGEYLHADITKYNRILMKLREEFIEKMCQVNPDYEQQVRHENRESFCIYK